MSDLQFNVMASSGKQEFITPRITVNVGKETKHVPSDIVLQVAYVIQALVNADPAQLGAKTKVAGGVAILEAVKALPKDSTLTLHMPTKDSDRSSDDLSKWTPCVTVKQADMLATCEAMKAINDTITSLIGDKDHPSKVGQYTSVQPVYHTGEQPAKTRGGKKTITSLI